MADVISEACSTAKTGDCHDKLTKMDLIMIAVTLTLSWLVLILTIMPVWHNSCFVFEHETIRAVFDINYHTKALNLTEHENLQNLECAFHFLFKDFCLCSHSDHSVTALGMFTNLYLVLLLLFAGLLFPKLYFQLIKKITREKSRKWSDIVQSSRWPESFQAFLLYVL